VRKDDRVNAERVARNNVIYREANERIESAAEEYDFSAPIPFICECADSTCTDVVAVPLRDYEEIRAEPTHFLSLPGHEQNPHEDLKIVRRHPDYVVVAKQGRAAEIVEDLDPREARHG
jgi:hypothetical protein